MRKSFTKILFFTDYSINRICVILLNLYMYVDVTFSAKITSQDPPTDEYLHCPGTSSILHSDIENASRI